MKNRTKLFILIAVIAVTVLMFQPAFAASLHQVATPENMATLILGIAGIALQIIFKFVPAVNTWYDAQVNKGLWMLGFVVLTGALYFGLSCTPLAGQFGIQVSCTVPDAVVMAKALFIIAAGQTLAYVYTRNLTAPTFLKAK